MITINRKNYIYRQNAVQQNNLPGYYAELVNWNSTPRSNIFRPPTDIFETDEKIIVRVEIAGVTADNFSVNFHNHLLTIQGVRQDSLVKRTFHQMEVQYGEFLIQIEIGHIINASQITATYAEGFLQVEMPKMTTSAQENC